MVAKLPGFLARPCLPTPMRWLLGLAPNIVSASAVVVCTPMVLVYALPRSGLFFAKTVAAPCVSNGPPTGPPRPRAHQLLTRGSLACAARNLPWSGIDNADPRRPGAPLQTTRRADPAAPLGCPNPQN
eukprot:321166-Lingulodinium_polyedra.AAC.1